MFDLVLFSLVPRPTLAVADGLHHRYARNGLVPRPTLAVADGLHHRYARNGSGKKLFRANSDVIGVGVAATLTNGVIGQLVYSNKMNRCKLCDAPVLECRNRRQLASATSQCCRAFLMGLAVETTKRKESAREYETGYLCKRCFDSTTKYLALQEDLISLHLHSRSWYTTVRSERRGTKRSAEDAPQSAVKVNLHEVILVG